MQTFYLISNIALWVFVLLQVAVLYTLTKTLVQLVNRVQYKIMRNQLSQALTLKVGSRAPVFREPDQHGRMISLSDNGGLGTLLVLTVDNSPMCKELILRLPELRALQLPLRICVIDDITPNGTPSEAPDGLHYFRSRLVYKSFHVKRAPFFVLVNEQGIVADLDPFSGYKELEVRLRKYFRLAG